MTKLTTHAYSIIKKDYGCITHTLFSNVAKDSLKLEKLGKSDIIPLGTGYSYQATLVR